MADFENGSCGQVRRLPDPSNTPLLQFKNFTVRLRVPRVSVVLFPPVNLHHSSQRGEEGVLDG
jgi:hypothetical protein